MTGSFDGPWLPMVTAVGLVCLVLMTCRTETHFTAAKILAGVVGLLIFTNLKLTLGGNVQLTSSVELAEFNKLRAAVSELNVRLFGDDAEGTSNQLASLATLLQNTTHMERKLRDVRTVLRSFEESRVMVDEFLHEKQLQEEAFLGKLIDSFLSRISEERFWQRMEPHLAMLGIIKAVNASLELQIASTRAKVVEELRIQHSVEENVERVKGELLTAKWQAMSHDFDERLPFRLLLLLTLLVTCLAAVFTFRLMYHLLLKHFLRPPLLDEVSISAPVKLRGICSARSSEAARDIFQGNPDAGSPTVILEPRVRESISDMAQVAKLASERRCRSCRSSKSGHALPALPSALFYGPPGTGKSLTARRLASSCGLDFGIMSGGNVLSLREEAVPELRKVFTWANRFGGFLLFIDEAEAFLSSRSGSVGSVYVQAAVSFFLAQTTESSHSLIIILATNRPEDLDDAVLSRLPFQIEFGRPSRAMLQSLVADRHESLSHEARSRLMALLADEAVDLYARGFVGRDVQSLFEEFQRRWLLETATAADSPGSKKVADKEWLARWLEQRKFHRHPS